MEGNCYMIRNVRVKEAPKIYNVVPHQYQLSLARDTVISQITETCVDIPHYAYIFTSLDKMPLFLNRFKYLQGITTLITIYILKVTNLLKILFICINMIQTSLELSKI